MCRNIKQLYNFDPVATEDEIRVAALQYVRKVTGFNTPSRINEDAFQQAVDDIAAITAALFDKLETRAKPKNREEERAKAKARNARRFGTE